MAVHPAGDGIAWESDVDVDQPHGLDYRYINHVAKAVQKRSDKEHVGYADATVGGEHIPGGCAVVGIEDATADISTGCNDGTYIGRDIIYDQTRNILCGYTGEGTAAALDDLYEFVWGSGSFCKGDDITWSGNWQFDGSVDFTSVEITGPLICDDSVNISGQLHCASAILCDDSMDVQDQADFSDVVISGSFCTGSTAITDASSGHVTLQGGLILQWGEMSVSGTATTDVTYDIAFPNDGMQVVTSPRKFESDRDMNLAVTDVSEEKFVHQGGDIGDLTIRWIAIGR
ncbi:MAG: hypothetical protein AMJ75_00270 [Phycisphaerae bacterium SM1_79]|nr:MAG: hypothetical protein AMJ75_00270 [Phycisphaerae bacterium SM1_79]